MLSPIYPTIYVEIGRQMMGRKKPKEVVSYGDIGWERCIDASSSKRSDIMVMTKSGVALTNNIGLDLRFVKRGR